MHVVIRLEKKKNQGRIYTHGSKCYNSLKYRNFGRPNSLIEAQSRRCPLLIIERFRIPQKKKNHTEKATQGEYLENLRFFLGFSSPAIGSRSRLIQLTFSVSTF